MSCPLLSLNKDALYLVLARLDIVSCVRLLSTCRRLHAHANSAAFAALLRHAMLCPLPDNLTPLDIIARCRDAARWINPQQAFHAAKVQEVRTYGTRPLSLSVYTAREWEGKVYIGTTSDIMHVFDLRSCAVETAFHIPTDSSSQYSLRFSDWLMLSKDSGSKLFDFGKSVTANTTDRDRNRGLIWHRPDANVSACAFVGQQPMVALSVGDTVQIVRTDDPKGETFASYPIAKGDNWLNWGCMAPIDGTDLVQIIIDGKLSVIDHRCQELATTIDLGIEPGYHVRSSSAGNYTVFSMQTETANLNILDRRLPKPVSLADERLQGMTFQIDEKKVVGAREDDVGTSVTGEDAGDLQLGFIELRGDFSVTGCRVHREHVEEAAVDPEPKEHEDDGFLEQPFQGQGRERINTNHFVFSNTCGGKIVMPGYRAIHYV